MVPSLSILLPVHNAQSYLAASAVELLELAGELADRVELLIIDDGSTDRTIEVASELATCYPQIDCVRHNVRRGLGLVIETGLRRTSGSMIIVHDGISAIEPFDVHRLWQRFGHGVRTMSADERRRVTNRVDRHLGGETPANAAYGLNTTVGGFHLLERSAIAPRIGRTQQRRRDAAARLSAQPPAAARKAPDRPNFLNRLRQFAINE